MHKSTKLDGVTTVRPPKQITVAPIFVDNDGVIRIYITHQKPRSKKIQLFRHDLGGQTPVIAIGQLMVDSGISNFTILSTSDTAVYVVLISDNTKPQLPGARIYSMPSDEALELIDTHDTVFEGTDGVRALGSVINKLKSSVAV